MNISRFFPYKCIRNQIWPCHKVVQGQARFIICANHLGHVTRTIWTNFRSRILRNLHMKFEFIWLSGFRGEDVWNCGWTDKGRRSDWYTISSPMSLWLRWAKKKERETKCYLILLEQYLTGCCELMCMTLSFCGKTSSVVSDPIGLCIWWYSEMRQKYYSMYSQIDLILSWVQRWRIWKSKTGNSEICPLFLVL